MKSPHRFPRTLGLLALGLLPLAAQAHPGHATHTDFFQGVLHPFSGLDHLLAAVGIGLWSAQQSGRLCWMLPASFVAMMGTGALLGLGLQAPDALDQTVAATTLLCGLFVAGQLRTRAILALGASSGFALLHGLAHGSEGPLVGAFPYALGFLSSTALLGCAGFIAARLARRLRIEPATRVAGGVIAVAGLALSLG